MAIHKNRLQAELGGPIATALLSARQNFRAAYFSRGKTTSEIL